MYATIIRADALRSGDALAEGISPWVEIDGTPVDWMTGDAPSLPLVSPGCDGCDGLGVLLGCETDYGLQRCDECSAYGGDVEAAEVVAAHLSGVARVALESPEDGVRTARVLVHHRSGRGRVALHCPRGHEVVDAPQHSATGRRLLAGDFTDETCGRVGCGWSGSTTPTT